MTEEILLEALERIINAETSQEAKEEAYDVLFQVNFPDEEMITL